MSIPRVMSAKDSIKLDNIDSKIWLNYLEQVCDVFRGEVPHVKHPKLVGCNRLYVYLIENFFNYCNSMQISNRIGFFENSREQGHCCT